MFQDLQFVISLESLFVPSCRSVRDLILGSQSQKATLRFPWPPTNLQLCQELWEGEDFTLLEGSRSCAQQQHVLRCLKEEIIGIFGPGGFTSECVAALDALVAFVYSVLPSVFRVASASVGVQGRCKNDRWGRSAAEYVLPLRWAILCTCRLAAMWLGHVRATLHKKP